VAALLHFSLAQSDRLTPAEGGAREDDLPALCASRLGLFAERRRCCLQHGAGLGTGGGPAGMHGALGDLDPSNTTLFIGGLSAAVRRSKAAQCCAP
jgi:hypothetical protein